MEKKLVHAYKSQAELAHISIASTVEVFKWLNRSVKSTGCTCEARSLATHQGWLLSKREDFQKDVFWCLMVVVCECGCRVCILATRIPTHLCLTVPLTLQYRKRSVSSSVLSQECGVLFF